MVEWLSAISKQPTADSHLAESQFMEDIWNLNYLIQEMKTF